MNIGTLYKEIKRKLKGNLRVAIENGMCVEDGVTVMGGVNFGSEPYLITLRKNCRISGNVLFVNHDGGTWAFRNDKDGYRDVKRFGRIEVGEQSFVGANSIIMPGVVIGHHAVIGAGSVVTKNVPPETVWAGVPARQICTLNEYAEKCKNLMPENFDIAAYQKDKKKYLIEIYGKR